MHNPFSPRRAISNLKIAASTKQQFVSCSKIPPVFMSIRRSPSLLFYAKSISWCMMMGVKVYKHFFFFHSRSPSCRGVYAVMSLIWKFLLRSRLLIQWRQIYTQKHNQKIFIRKNISKLHLRLFWLLRARNGWCGSSQGITFWNASHTNFAFCIFRRRQCLFGLSFKQFWV